MDGRDVSEAIRSMQVSQHTNPIASNPGIRRILVEKQRQIGKGLGSLVTEGRDQGSVVFPEADLRVLLEASDVKRAERRCLEMRADGEEVDFDEVLTNIRNRDGNDQVQWESLLADPRVVRIDTTNMTIAQMVERLRKEVDRVRAGKG
jgi:cytidylate kinase